MPIAPEQPTIVPTVLALHITYRCPLQCSHCCVDAGPSRRTELQASQVTSLIRQAASDCHIKGIGITGGDPFLLPALASLAVREAKSRGLNAHVVTSAFWARTPEEARERLDVIAGSGLDELCISYDDPHSKFIAFEKVLNAYQAAMERGIKVRFLVAAEPGATITNKWIHDRVARLDCYNAELTSITYGAIVSTGRALSTSTKELRLFRAASQEKYLGPCPIVFRRLAVNPDGNILACCGTIPFYEDLCIGNVATHTLPKAIAGMYSNLLLKWIAFEGPVEVLKRITASDKTPLTDADFEGICDACNLLFSNPTLRAKAYAVAEEEVERLAIEELIFRSVGHFPEFMLANSVEHQEAH